MAGQADGEKERPQPVGLHDGLKGDEGEERGPHRSDRGEEERRGGGAGRKERSL